MVSKRETRMETKVENADLKTSYESESVRTPGCNHGSSDQMDTTNPANGTPSPSPTTLMGAPARCASSSLSFSWLRACVTRTL